MAFSAVEKLCALRLRGRKFVLYIPVRYTGVVVRMHHGTVGERVDAPGVLEELARMYHLVILLQVAEAVQLQAQLLQLQSSPHLHPRSLLKQSSQRRRRQLAPVVQRGRALSWFYDLHKGSSI